jgi:hypothetical protein
MGSPLVAFALVADEYQKSGDPVKGLRPLFAPILFDRIGKAFDALDFASRFEAAYGLKMTAFIANALSERLAEIGLLSLVPGTYNSYEVADFDWSPEGIDEEQIDQTISLFAKWAKEKLRFTNRAFEEKQLEEAILTRLARPAFSSIFSDIDSSSKTKKIKSMLGLGAIDPTVNDEIYLDYLVAEFILTTSEAAPEVFNAISQIAYGSLIADAVAGLAVPEQIPTQNPPLRVVLDSPLLLDILDLNTVEHKAYADGLLSMIKDAGLMVAVFDHSVEEMRGTIDSTLQAFAKKDAFGPLAERLRTTPGHALYARTMMDTLETQIKRLEITILPSRLYEEAR